MEPIGKAPLSLNREAPSAEAQAKKLKEVAELYEKQFLREMVKAMRSTVSESEFIKSSQAEKIFKEQLDHEYVEKWGEKGGIGLADMIHKQLLDRYGVQLGLTKPERIPHGPMKLSSHDFISTSTLPSANPAGTVFKLSAPTGKPAVITSPWSGKYLGDFKLEENLDSHNLAIRHENGLTSTLSYAGSALAMPPGTLVSAGQDLGQTSTEKPNLIWQVRPF